MGLVQGMVEGVALQAFELHAPGPFCIPAEVTGDQMMRVVMQYIDQRPLLMHDRFVFLAYDALKEAWPCKP
jgi:hypothetical protein